MALNDPQLYNDTHILFIFRHYAFLSTLVCKNAFLLFALEKRSRYSLDIEIGYFYFNRHCSDI